MGIVLVSALAASAPEISTSLHDPYAGPIGEPNISAAIAGNRSFCSSAQRYSMPTLLHVATFAQALMKAT